MGRRHRPQHRSDRPEARSLLRRQRERPLGRDLLGQRARADQGRSTTRSTCVRLRSPTATPAARVRVGRRDRDSSTTTPSRPATTCCTCSTSGRAWSSPLTTTRARPDTIGLYGALETPLGVGVRSGIDEYYMRFLDYRIAQAAAAAVASLRPARPVRQPGRGRDSGRHGRQPVPAAERDVAADLRPVPHLGRAPARRPRRGGRHEDGRAAGPDAVRHADLHRRQPRRSQPGDGRLGSPDQRRLARRDGARDRRCRSRDCDLPRRRQRLGGGPRVNADRDSERLGEPHQPADAIHPVAQATGQRPRRSPRTRPARACGSPRDRSP